MLDRHPQGRREHGVHVPLARGDRPARLPADGQGPPAADPGGRASRSRAPSSRCSTSAAASSTPAPRPSCARSPRRRRSRSSRRCSRKGAFPDSHPLSLQMPGMHGSKFANWALHRSDLLITVGARFDDRVTGKLDAFAPGAKVIHMDIDPAEISKNRTADIPIVGELREVLPQLTKAIAKLRESDSIMNHRAWLEQVEEWKFKYPLPLPPRRRAQAAVRDRAAARPARGPRHDLDDGRRPAPDVGGAVAARRRDPRASSPPAGSARWASDSPRRSAPRWAGRRRPSSASTATAASR